METQNAAYFQKEILPQLSHDLTIRIVTDVIDHAKTLESSMEEGKPRDQKPKPDFGKCDNLRSQLIKIAKKFPVSDFNKQIVKTKIEDLLKYTERLEKKANSQLQKEM